MIFLEVRRQLTGVFERVIETGVSIQQNFPSTSVDGSIQTLGNMAGTSIALKNIPYKDIYAELEQHGRFHVKLPDGGLLLFQYEFKDQELVKHRLAYFPSPVLPTVEEAPDLYQRDELYGDILLNRIVRFPIRFDFDPENYKLKFHPHSHMTLGQFDNCRIPVSHPIPPNAFLLFVLRNFYHLLYRRHQNAFEKHISHCSSRKCITEQESVFPYLKAF